MKFDAHDLGGWVASFFTWWRRLIKKHAWISPPADPVRQIGNQSRIALLGGNQSDAVNIAGFPLSRLLGLRRLRG